MKLSRLNRAVKEAYSRGYSVTKDGDVKSPSGDTREVNLDTSGRERFSILLSDDRYVNVMVHKLQAYQKFGDELFEDGIQVRHLNGDKRDNSRSNIDIGTQSDNLYDIPEEERSRLARERNMSLSEEERTRRAKDAVRNGMQKVDDKEAKEIKRRVKNDNYDTYKDLASEYGLKSKSSITYIVNNRVFI